MLNISTTPVLEISKWIIIGMLIATLIMMIAEKLYIYRAYRVNRKFALKQLPWKVDKYEDDNKIPLYDNYVFSTHNFAVLKLHGEVQRIAVSDPRFSRLVLIIDFTNKFEYLIDNTTLSSVIEAFSGTLKIFAEDEVSIVNYASYLSISDLNGNIIRKKYIG